VLRGVVFACVLIGCAPVVDAPAERAQVTDIAESDRLSAQLGALPGAWSAHATLHRAFREPLTGATSPAVASALIVVEESADRGALQRAAEALVRATIPDVAAPTVIVVTGAPRPELARVGPFRVERGSRVPLLATLAVCLLAIVALALAYARNARSL
jgi:type III secretory pathway lipoprotein EscJ